MDRSYDVLQAVYDVFNIGKILLQNSMAFFIKKYTLYHVRHNLQFMDDEQLCQTVLYIIFPEEKNILKTE